MSVTSARGLKNPSDLHDDPPAPGAQATLRALEARTLELERRLRDSEDRWDLLALAAEQGIWEWAPSAGTMRWSAQFTRTLGYAEGEIVPSVASFNALLHPEDSAGVWRAMEDHVAGKTELYESEFRVRARDGSFRRVRSRGKARHDDRGTAARMVGTMALITEREQSVEGAAPKSPESAKAAGSADLPVAKCNCSTCKSDLLVRSRWRLWERPLMLLLIRPARCRTCGRRAFKPVWAGVPKPSRGYRRASASSSDS